MKKLRGPLILIFLGILALMLRKNMPMNNEEKTPSEIDALLQQGSGNTTTRPDIVIATGDNGMQYTGGGEYALYTPEKFTEALTENKRIILAFERIGDPTSDALHDDIVARAARIPENTIIFFADFDTQATLDTRYSVEGPNTIIYLSNNATEIRRTGNGIVTLEQIVKNVDGLY